jgi:hypothetical protein
MAKSLLSVRYFFDFILSSAFVLQVFILLKFLPFSPFSLLKFFLTGKRAKKKSNKTDENIKFYRSNIHLSLSCKIFFVNLPGLIVNFLLFPELSVIMGEIFNEMGEKIIERLFGSVFSCPQ